jgi:hypothetical protein
MKGLWHRGLPKYLNQLVCHGYVAFTWKPNLAVPAIYSSLKCSP